MRRATSASNSASRAAGRAALAVPGTVHQRDRGRHAPAEALRDHLHDRVVLRQVRAVPEQDQRQRRGVVGAGRHEEQRRRGAVVGETKRRERHDIQSTTRVPSPPERHPTGPRRREDDHARTADRARLHRTGRARLRRPDRCRRRARPARRIARRAHVAGDRAASHGPRPPGLDALGVGAGERVAIVSHNSARLLTSFFGVSAYGRVLVPINFRLNAEEIGYIVEHSGASVLLVDPELEQSLAGVTARHRFVIGKRGRRRAPALRHRARAVDPRRGRDRNDQLHEWHDRASEGRAAHPPHAVGERDDVRLADRR